MLALLTGTDDEVLESWGRWYLADRDPRWVRRNALVVLGNTADPTDRIHGDRVPSRPGRLPLHITIPCCAPTPSGPHSSWG